MEILERVWDWAYDGTSNVIDVYVRSLRTKMGDDPSAPRIETVRGAGYVLRLPGGRVGLRDAIGRVRGTGPAGPAGPA